MRLRPCRRRPSTDVPASGGTVVNIPASTRAYPVRAGHVVEHAVPGAGPGAAVVHLRTLVDGPVGMPWISTASARPAGPQPVRTTPVNDRRDPTHTNGEMPGQRAACGSAAGQDQVAGIPLQRVAGDLRHAAGLANMQVKRGSTLRGRTPDRCPCRGGARTVGDPVRPPVGASRVVRHRVPLEGRWRGRGGSTTSTGWSVRSRARRSSSSRRATAVDRRGRVRLRQGAGPASFVERWLSVVRGAETLGA